MGGGLKRDGMACPQFMDGESGIQMWRVAAQLRTADKRWYSSFDIERRIKAHHFKTQGSMKMSQVASDLELFFHTTQGI
jgi:hypothetical protein